MLKRKIPLAIAVPFLLVLIGGFFLLDDRAATAATAVKPTVWNNDDCLKCHVDKAILKKMQDKAGDPTFCQAAYDRLTHAKTGQEKKDPGYNSVNWK